MSLSTIQNSGSVTADESLSVQSAVSAVCQRIAPLWPLDAFVAVSPYFGLRDQDFEKANEILGRVARSSLLMPRRYYAEQILSGRIARADLEKALKEQGLDMTVSEAEKSLGMDSPILPAPTPLFSDVLGDREKTQWSGFILEQISQFCASYFDQGQAIWKESYEKEGLYEAWRQYAQIDLSPRMMGLRDVRRFVAGLPQNAESLIALAVRRLGIPADMLEDYLLAALMSVGGWASWARYLRWEKELVGGEENSIVDLLAIRLAWELILFHSRELPQWRQVWTQPAIGKTAKNGAMDGTQLDFALQTAFEMSYQRKIIAELAQSGKVGNGKHAAPVRPSVQAAFCIDVRSEVYRRALETVAPSVQTVGFAGFFGAFMEFVPLGASEPRIHLPVLLSPGWQGHERIRGGSDHDVEKAIKYRRKSLHGANNWKSFKSSPSSCFSFVESTGLLYGAKLLGDTFGWSRPVPHPAEKGHHPGVKGKLVPTIEAVSHGKNITKTRQKTADSPTVGVPPTNRGGLAELILRAMSMTGNFARLVLLVGHGSSTYNNPYATGLDCGACAGQTGEVSARVIASLLNESTVREELAEKGIHIPPDTRFIGALHDTTVDRVDLFDTEEIETTHGQDLRQLRDWLAKAGQLTRMERSSLLGIPDSSPEIVDALVHERSRDWSQVRPEWGLAGNAAFIAAPRSRTAGIDLSGRSFLHDYDWRKDEGFGVLELIMTAPMVVANWINLQYYASVVDNKRFGSGNKVLHNIVGGNIGVLEGNGGDLRVGLPMQSLHDGERWVHEPLRLNVFLEAPKSAIDDIIAKHELVRELVENRWLFIFEIDNEHGGIYQRTTDKQWKRVS